MKPRCVHPSHNHLLLNLVARGRDPSSKRAHHRTWLKMGHRPGQAPPPEENTRMVNKHRKQRSTAHVRERQVRSGEIRLHAYEMCTVQSAGAPRAGEDAGCKLTRGARARRTAQLLCRAAWRFLTNETPSYHTSRQHVPGYSLEGVENHIHTKTCTRVFITAYSESPKLRVTETSFGR